MSKISEVLLAISDMVEKKYTSEEGFVLKYCDEISLGNAIEVILKTHCDVVQYDVNDVDIFDSPGYDTGIVYAAWVEKSGNLYTIDYQWELM